MVVLSSSGDIFVMSLFANEVSGAATVICGFANTNTPFKVKFKLEYALVVCLFMLMLDSPREGLSFSMEMVTAQLIVPAPADQPCP